MTDLSLALTIARLYAGDTNTARQLSDEERAAKARREREAIARLGDELEDAQCLALLRCYESQIEPEARLVRYLDKVLPKLTHGEAELSEAENR